MSASNKIILPVILSSYRPKVDGSFSISLTTQILGKQQRDIVHELYQQVCSVLIQDSEITKADESLMEAINIDSFGIKTKTKSQRLREIIYHNWKQEHPDEAVTSKDYYDTTMEKIIDHFISKLEV